MFYIFMLVWRKVSDGKGRGHGNLGACADMYLSKESLCVFRCPLMKGGMNYKWALLSHAWQSYR